MPESYTLIGDVIESRRTPDRFEVQIALGQILEDAGGHLGPGSELEPTLGDEFQGRFRRVSDAIAASLIVRLDLQRRTGVDTRYGLGSGGVDVFAKRTPILQDGPGWWAAREAIEETAELASAPSSRFVRTWFKAADGGRKGDAGEALNAFLLCRDAMVDRMKSSTRGRLLGLMVGESQAGIAEREGATQGAVSQSLQSSNAFAIVLAQRQLEKWFG
jgi:hypothetical protein